MGTIKDIRGAVNEEGVSIQLMSPASGDFTMFTTQELHQLYSFHSINVPSEWGQAFYAADGG